jgi:hypothetical protein
MSEASLSAAAAAAISTSSTALSVAVTCAGSPPWLALASAIHAPAISGSQAKTKTIWDHRQPGRPQMRSFVGFNPFHTGNEHHAFSAAFRLAAALG